MASVRALILPCWTVLALASPSAEAAEANEPRIRSQKGLTDGVIEVSGEARDLYAALTDYARWPEIFPDVASAHVTAGTRDRPVVEVRDHGGKRHVLRFENDARRLTIRFREQASRARVSVVLVLARSTQPGWSKLSARLKARVTGLARLFAGEGRVRRERESRLRRDLGHVRDFAERVVASAQ